MIPALAFTTDIQHSHDLAQVMRDHGVRAFPVSGKTPDGERQRLYRGYRAGGIDMLASCGVLGVGADFPTAMVALMCSPTRSGLTYRQNLGRVLRPYPAPQGNRPYQRDCLMAVLKAAQQGCVDQLLVLATGLGKTRIASHFPQLLRYWKGSRARGRIMYLVHLDILAEQAADTFQKSNPDMRVGIEKAGSYAENADIVIGSVQTLGPPDKRLGLPYGQRLRSFRPDQFDAVVHDEVHVLPGFSYSQTILRWFRALMEEDRDQEVLGVGTTATPGRSDSRGLEKYYSKITFNYDITDGVAGGYLARPTARRVETEVNIDEVKRRGDDFNVRQLEMTVNTPERNELIARTYLDICRQEGMFGEFRLDDWEKPHAIAVDFVDNTTKHELVLAPSLFGLGRRFNPKGRDLIKTAQEVKDLQKKHPTLDLRAETSLEGIYASLKDVDLLAPPVTPAEAKAASRMPWLADGEGYRLSYFGGGLITMQPDTLGTWEIARHNNGIRSVAATEKDLKKAFSLADKLVPVDMRGKLNVNAEWTKLEPKEAQAFRIWHNDPNVRAKFGTKYDYFNHCARCFRGGDKRYSRGAMGARINALQIRAGHGH